MAVDAHSTVETVSEILESTHATETTVRAVIGTLLIGHPQVANGTVIFTELYIAVDAKVAVYFLVHVVIK